MARRRAPAGGAGTPFTFAHNGHDVTLVVSTDGANLTAAIGEWLAAEVRAGRSRNDGERVARAAWHRFRDFAPSLPIGARPITPAAVAAHDGDLLSATFTEAGRLVALDPHLDRIAVIRAIGAAYLAASPTPERTSR